LRFKECRRKAVVDLLIREGLKTGRWQKLLAGLSGGLFVYAVLAIVGSAAVDAQESAESVAGRPAGNERVIRLQDSLDAGKDWDIGVPLPVPDSPTDSSFAGLIRAGRALESEAYRVLDSELRQVKQLLPARPEDEAVRQQLEELQDALAQRVEINLDFDYLYAAAVYIELFRQADGPPGAVRRFRRMLSERQSAQVE